jgi:anoctamin-10
MVPQFGYLSLFSVVWPLTACSFLVNNWLELRSDAIKITVEMQRPTPWRADTIGPWLDSLGFLTWLGSITSAALVFLFSNGHGPGGSPVGIKGWGLLLTIFFSEHIYMVVRLAVRTALSKLESPGLQKERAEKFLVRKRYFEESVESLESRAAPNVSRMGEKVDRAALEDQARHGSLHGSTPESRFWDQQGGWEDTIKVGSSIIAQAAPSEGKKVQ